MAKHNTYDRLHDEQAGLPSSGSMFHVPALNGVMLAWGDTVPTDGDTGYAKGCLFIKTNATNQTNLLYANIGSGTSSNFNLVTVASD